MLEWEENHIPYEHRALADKNCAFPHVTHHFVTVPILPVYDPGGPLQCTQHAFPS